MQRVSLDTVEDPINGPFSSIDAAATIGSEALINFSKLGMVFWSDHTKQGYYSFQEIQTHHKDSTTWVYSLPNLDLEASAHYGRIKIYKYGARFLVKDTFTTEYYMAMSLRHAFEISVMVVHFFPNERVIPDIQDGKAPSLPKCYPTQADYGIASGGELNTVWVESDKAPVSTSRSVNISLADAISIIHGDRPSIKLLADLCSTYPAALIAAHGAPLVVFNTKTTVVAVAQSIATLALTNSILSVDAIDNFVNDKLIADYRIVGGWGYDYLQQVRHDRNAVAMVDLALSQSSSPSMLEINIQKLFLFS